MALSFLNDIIHFNYLKILVFYCQPAVVLMLPKLTLCSDEGDLLPDVSLEDYCI